MIFYQLPRGDPTDPVWDLWCVSQTGGTPTLVRRNAGWGGLGAGPLFRNLAYLSPISKDDFTGGGLWIGSFDERAVIPRGLFLKGTSRG